MDRALLVTKHYATHWVLFEMKIPASVRRLFEDQMGKNVRLKNKVDERIKGIKDERWHYESRVKMLPSFALKVESGRFPNPGALEDFFASTLVVANAAELDRAESLVLSNFTLIERRPRKAEITHKRPESFPFDDLRLYVRLSTDTSMPKSDLMDITFELQIKTFLQHAWSIATHDLIYKSDEVNWGTERIAFQTKAMLEHAEVSIQEAQRLASCSILAKQDRPTEQIRAGIELLKQHWGASELPENVRLLAHNLINLLNALEIDLDRLRVVLDDGKKAHSGAHPSNLSPYGIIVQYLFRSERGKMENLLKQPYKKYAHPKPVRVLIPAEVEIPDDIDRKLLCNAIFIN